MKLNSICKFVSGIIVFSVLSTTTIAEGQTHFGFRSESGIKVKADSWFSGNIKTTKKNHSGVKMLSNKYVKSTRVRIVEGDFNRVGQSRVSPKKGKKVFYRASLSKYNNPFEVAYTSYNFDYFK